MSPPKSLQDDAALTELKLRQTALIKHYGLNHIANYPLLDEVGRDLIADRLQRVVLETRVPWLVDEAETAAELPRDSRSAGRFRPE